MNALVTIGKDTSFLINDSRLDEFTTAGNVETMLLLLRDVAQEVVDTLPISLLVPVWPPHELVLRSFAEKAPVRIMYNVLKDVLSNAGYSLGVLTTLKVEKHDPTELTVFKAQARFRVYTLH